MRTRERKTMAGLGALALIGAMAVAAPLTAQQAGPRGGNGPGLLRGGPQAGPRGAGIEMMLRNRATLGLTEEQVASLEALQEELSAEMAPLRESIREEAAAMREEERATREERMERLRPRLEEVRAIQEAHGERVREVLNQDQELALEKMLRQTRRGGGERGGLHRPGGRRGPRGGGA